MERKEQKQWSLDLPRAVRGAYTLSQQTMRETDISMRDVGEEIQSMVEEFETPITVSTLDMGDGGIMFRWYPTTPNTSP